THCPPGSAWRPEPMRSLMKRFLLAATLILLAGTVRADDAKTAPPAAGDAPVVLADDGLPVDAPAPRRVRGFFNRIGVCCFHDRDAVGCESFRSEMQFIFGSCRTFFTEPCQPKKTLSERRAERGGILGSASGCTGCGGW